jgi:hypothetical protein
LRLIYVNAVSYAAPLVSDVVLMLLIVTNVEIAFYTLIDINSLLIILIILLSLPYGRTVAYVAPPMSDVVLTLLILFDVVLTLLICNNILYINPGQFMFNHIYYIVAYNLC